MGSPEHLPRRESPPISPRPSQKRLNPSRESLEKQLELITLREQIVNLFDQRFSKPETESDLVLLQILDATQNPFALKAILQDSKELLKQGGDEEGFVMELADSLERREPGTLVNVLKQMNVEQTSFHKAFQESIQLHQEKIHFRKATRELVRVLLKTSLLNEEIRYEMACSLMELLSQGYAYNHTNMGRVCIFDVFNSPQGKIKIVWRSDGKIHDQPPPFVQQKMSLEAPIALEPGEITENEELSENEEAAEPEENEPLPEDRFEQLKSPAQNQEINRILQLTPEDRVKEVGNIMRFITKNMPRSANLSDQDTAQRLIDKGYAVDVEQAQRFLDGSFSARDAREYLLRAAQKEE